MATSSAWQIAGRTCVGRGGKVHIKVSGAEQAVRAQEQEWPWPSLGQKLEGAEVLDQIEGREKLVHLDWNN